MLPTFFVFIKINIILAALSASLAHFLFYNINEFMEFTLHLVNLRRSLHILSSSFQNQCQLAYRQKKRIADNTKKIYRDLIYFYKLTKCYLSDKIDIISLLKECISVISTANGWTDILNSQQFYSLTSFVLNKFQQILNFQDNRYIQSHNLVKQINQLLVGHCSNRKTGILPSELQALKKNNINFFMHELMYNRVLLQNHQCVGCSSVLIRGSKIGNCNKKMGMIIGLNLNKAFEKGVLQKYINCLCNQGGGVMIIGCQQRQGKLVVSGAKIQNTDHLIRIEKDIITAFYSIQPQCLYQICKIMIHSNFFEDEKLVIKQKNRICFRITVVPAKKKQISYLRHAGNNITTYTTYRLNEQGRPTNVNQYFDTKQQFYQNFYTYAHQQYKKYKVRANSHRNIKCFLPYNDYSIKYYIYVNSNLTPLTVSSSDSSDGAPQFEDFVIHYKFATLLVVKNKMYDRYVEDLEWILVTRKYDFQCSKPYFKLFKEDTEIIYLISHQITFSTFRQIMSELENDKDLQKGAIKILPIYQDIQVQQCDLNSNKMEYLSKMFLKYFKNIYEVKSKKVAKLPKQVNVTCFRFSNRSESVFGYMVLNQLGVKSHRFKSPDTNKTN